MKTILIAGNWKSNFTNHEASVWVRDWNAKCQTRLPAPERSDGGQVPNAKLENNRIVLFAPFTLLYSLKQEIHVLGLPIELGAQDVSPYPEGAHTGEESAQMIKELATWVLVGHSERRKDFHETDMELASEVKQAKLAGLSVMYCVSDETMPVPEGVDVIAYEPTWAIGTGKTETPEHANEVIQKLLSANGVGSGLYGGSVTAQNVGQFVSQGSIAGVLVGGASLDPQSFTDIITAASSVH